jgi:hypothetical protein
MMDINPNRPDAQQAGERPLNLSDFAQRNQMTEDRVWELIEEGELAARFVNDEILILREQDTVSEPQIDLQDAPVIPMDDASDILPSHPVSLTSPEPAMLTTEPVAEEIMIAAPVESDPAPGPVEMPDHMETPRPLETTTKRGADTAPDFFADRDVAASDEDMMPGDDYRDLLVFAQDAMNRTMDLSRQLLATKDELIRMKDDRIQQLQGELQRNEHEIRRLRKKVEDLETLCRLTPNP